MPNAPHRLHTLPDVDATLMRWLQTCLDDLRAPVATMAEGRVAPDTVHACRTGLRRLRSAFDLARGFGHTAPESLLWTQTFRMLGASRDDDVLQDLLGPVAWQQLATWLQQRPSASVTLGRDDLPAHFSAHGPFMRAWHELAQWLSTAHAAPHTGEQREAWRRHVRKRLTRWHDGLHAAAHTGHSLEDEALHDARKRCKRLQQALQWLRPHLDRSRRKAYLQRLRAAQQQLGVWHDLHMARVRCQGAPRHLGCDAATRLAWIEHEEKRVRADAVRALRRLARGTPCWT